MLFQTRGPWTRAVPAGPQTSPHMEEEARRLSDMFCSMFQDPYPTTQNMTHFSHMLNTPHQGRVLCKSVLHYGKLAPAVPLLDLLIRSECVWETPPSVISLLLLSHRYKTPARDQV